MIATLIESNFNKFTKQAALIIKSGGIVIIPFDTVYGFACDPKNDKAIEKIYALKNRPLKQTMGVAVTDIDQIKKLVKTDHSDFVKERTPGPFTFILKSTEKTLSDYCYKEGTIGVRIPDNQFILEVIRNSGGVIAQTSANKTGQSNCLSTEELKDHFTNEELDSVDLIVDGGIIDHGKASEIWNLTGNTARKIER